MDTQTDVGRAAWMIGGWGLMHHYNKDGLQNLDAFDEQTDRFDVETLARQLHDLGIRWFIVCLCHNSSSPYWCAPSHVLERYVPSRVCSRRDLVADLAAVLSPLGIRTMVYVWPWYEAQCNREVQDALAVGYPARWCEVLEEYSQRWAQRVAGWWVDGPGLDPEANLARLAAALRAGNPGCALAFNGGWGKLDRHSFSDDYCAGEHLNLPPCLGHQSDGAVRHLLNPIGAYWGGARDMVDGVDARPELKFPDQRLADSVIDWTVRHRAAITLDVPLQSHQGTIGSLGGIVPEMYYRQLQAVAEQLRGAKAADVDRALNPSPLDWLVHPSSLAVQRTRSSAVWFADGWPAPLTIARVVPIWPVRMPPMAVAGNPDTAYFLRIRNGLADLYGRFHLEPPGGRGYNVCLCRDTWTRRKALRESCLDSAAPAAVT